jgi:hypothetical protein
MIHSIHTYLERLKALDCIHLSGKVAKFLLLYYLSLENDSLSSFLVHIPCIHFHD